MIDPGTYLPWLLLINGAVLTLAWLAINHLQRGHLKTIYLLFLLAGTLWVNLIYCVKFFPMSDPVAIILSRSIFISILLTVVGFGCFMIAFCGLQDEFRSIRFYVFMLANAALIAASAAGYVESGITRSERGIAPIYGPLHPVLVTSNFLCGAYIFWLAIKSFRVSNDSIFRDQMRILFGCCLFAFVWAGSMNGILPVVTGSSAFSHVGPLGFLVLYAGILWIVLEQRTLFVSRDLGNLLRIPAFSEQGNVLVLKQLLLTVGDLLTLTPTPMFRKRYPFKSSAQTLELTVSHGIDGAMEYSSQPGQIQGFADNVRILEEHNRRLAFALIEAQGLLRDEGIRRTLESNPGNLPSARGVEYILSEFETEVARTCNEIHEIYGQSLPIFSRKRRDLLVQLKRYAPSKLAPIFVGEPGSGRSTNARMMHHLRNGKGLIEVSCLSDLAETRQQLARFKEAGSDVGLLIRDAHALTMDSWNLIETYFKGDRACYVTADAENLSEHLQSLPSHIRSLILQLRLDVPSLQSTPDDIFFGCVEIVARRGAELSKPFASISRAFIRNLQRSRWAGNFLEFQAYMELAIVSSGGTVLNFEPSAPRIDVPVSAVETSMDSGLPGLSPLENAERHTILAFLQKNNFNQRKTSEELDIRPNTLIVKMRKYGISRLRPRATRSASSQVNANLL